MTSCRRKPTVAENQTRRWFQFSLRTLLVFVLLASIGMSWLGGKMERARRQKEAVEAIQNLDEPWIIEVCFEESPPLPVVPEWASAVFGDHFFVDAVEVHLVGGVGR